LSNTKYPSEFPRTQRKLKELKRFKASEFRNFIFYLTPALKEILSAEIFNHYLVYATAIRLLTDDCLELDHIKSAQNLINYFVRTFSDIYGIENMPYKLHSHLHLPSQVLNFGPINKVSSFPFEGVFKICKTLVHGTRGYVNQIYQNLSLKHYISDKLNKVVEKLECISLKVFIKETEKKFNKSYNCSRFITLKELDNYIKSFLMENGFEEDDKIEIFSKFNYKNIGMN
jgi:hypothetical protein